MLAGLPGANTPPFLPLPQVSYIVELTKGSVTKSHVVLDNLFSNPALLKTMQRFLTFGPLWCPSIAGLPEFAFACTQELAVNDVKNRMLKGKPHYLRPFAAVMAGHPEDKGRVKGELCLRARFEPRVVPNMPGLGWCHLMCA